VVNDTHVRLNTADVRGMKRVRDETDAQQEGAAPPSQRRLMEATSDADVVELLDTVTPGDYDMSELLETGYPDFISLAVPHEEDTPLTCGICCAEATKTDKAVSLASATRSNFIVPPCKNTAHTMCGACMFRIVTNYHNHPIGVNSPHITCPFECSTHYSTNDFTKLLGKEEMTKLAARAVMYKNKGMVEVEAPNGSKIKVNALTLKDHQVGVCILAYPGPPDDDEAKHFCYDCFEDEHIMFIDHDDTLACEACLSNGNTVGRARGINQYFYRPDKKCEDGQPTLMRNSELTPELVVDQLVEMGRGDSLPSKCFNCLYPLHKSAACNELSHCGIKRCYVCGMSGSEHNTFLCDHWSASGNYGCPRWDTDRFWDHLGIKLECHEGDCFSDSHDCTEPSHAMAVQQMVHVRRLRHIRAALVSLPRCTYTKVMMILAKFYPTIMTLALSAINQ